MQRLLFPFFSLLLFFTALQGKTYDLRDDPIDILIPCCGKDVEVLEHCIQGAKENIKNIRRIIVVSPKKYTNNAEWFDEKDYPFSIKDVASELIGNEKKVDAYLKYGGRTGWYFQQLLKLYSHIVIPDVSSNLLILDADTIFLKPVAFLNDQNGGLFAPDKRIHQPYFVHMKRLIPDLLPGNPKVSGVAHHMLFQRDVILDLLKTIEDIHGIDAWKALCRLVDNNDLYRSGMSEYEIYFNFALLMTDQVEIRELKFRDIARLKDIPRWKKQGYDFVSCHHYLRQ